MFENLIAQPASTLLEEDISALRLPPSILFSGNSASGKLTAALELGRILSCHEKTALWTCSCTPCQRHKELIHPDLLIIGPRDCALEIRAASAAFLRSRSIASRFLFIRSVRKLILRFNPALQDSDDSKFARAIAILQDLDEKLEELSPSRPLPEESKVLEKLVLSIVDSAGKLEDDFLPDAIPVSQVRNASVWARLSPSGNRKVLIVENADRMQDSARNAFLKVLEEPPTNTVFILLTSRRGAIMPTILSRVRTYAFIDRPLVSQHEVITRVFHDVPQNSDDLHAYFNRFLPVSPEIIAASSRNLLESILIDAMDNGRRPLAGLREVLDASQIFYSSSERMTAGSIIVSLNKCKPRVIWNIFLGRIARFMRDALRTSSIDARETEVYSRWTNLIREALDSVVVYNLSPQAALEILSQNMKDAL